MATNTENYGLTKPDTNEFYDISVQNGNMDKIDAQLKANHDTAAAAITGATFGGTAVPQDGTKLEIPMPTAEQVGASNPNRLINGDMRIARHVSSLPQQYVIDRWKSEWFSEQGTITCGQKYDEYHYFIEAIVQAVTGTTMSHSIVQYIEDDATGHSPLGGKTVTFSASVHTSSDNICLGIKYYDSSDNVFAAAYVPVPKDEVRRLSITATLPTNIHKVHVGMLNINYMTQQDVGTYHNIWDAKLELGSVATPFSPRPYAEELAMCQRYYQIRSTNSISSIDLRPSMHIDSPTISTVSNGYAYDAEIY